ncbi:extracellular solute-binding protein [Rhodomicrobium sp. Az07]|nr:extracellular solute-binding protein [Rhodomicrobium sp. Az07]
MQCRKPDRFARAPRLKRHSAARMVAALFAAVLMTVSTAAEPRGGIAMHDAPKYADGFANLAYVNPAAPKGGALRLAVLGSFDSVNPFIIKGAPVAGAREYLYETLLARTYDEPFSLYGLIAETVDTPEDRSSVAFQVRPEARFADGKPITPDDVLFSWKLLKERGRPNHRGYYSKVVKAEKIGERGVKFTFDGADREMPLIMGLMPVLPRHALTPESFERTSFDKPISSGPYVIEEIEPGASITYRKNPDWWGRNLPFNRGQYNFERIRIDYYRDRTTMMEAFRKGLFDVLGDSDPIDAVRWADSFDFPAVENGLVNKLAFDLGVPAPMSALAFNTRRPVFADKRVREALTEVFDFEWLNKALYRGLYARTESFFDRSELSSHGRAATDAERALLAPYTAELAPGILDGTFSQPATDASGTNRDGRRRAIQLLDEAGYELRDGRMVSKATGAPLSFEMICVSREQERLLLAYSHALAQIGVEGRVRMIDSAQFQRRATSFDFDMMQTIWGSSLSPGNEQSFRWSSASAKQDGSFNYAGVESKGADAMIAAMLSAKTREEFVAAVRALDRILLSGRYAIPLYYAPKQWIAAWAQLRQPPVSTLYGTRLETWWAEPSKSAATGAGTSDVER